MTTWHERRFEAMGSAAHVLVAGAPRLLDQAEARVEQLEARWSRFRLDSELSRLNRRRDGQPWAVSQDTATLVQACVTAWNGTQGRFDPTMHDAIVALGYDADFDVVAASGDRFAAAGRAVPGRGLAGVVVDPRSGTVTLPADVRLDPGGLGKGLAADLVVVDLLDAGASGVMVNLGGDLAVAGTAPSGDGWCVAVDDPFAPGDALRHAQLVAGGVATSSTLRRRWRSGGEAVHHLLDPSTGRPARAGIAAATVVAGSAWWAEALATTLVVAGTAPLRGEAALVVTDDRTVHLIGDTDGVLVDVPALATSEAR